MKYKLAIFDMDGTILDTLRDLADSLNYALEMSGFKERTIDEVRSFVGNGLRKLVERGVPSGTDEKQVDRVLSILNGYYKIHCADTTKVYDGINELFLKLKNNNMKIAVVSNKADFGVQELCKQYFDGVFDIAVGEQPSVRKKPAPDSVNAVLKKLGIDKKDAVYIGDSEVDIQTAKNADLDCISVDWGFRSREKLVENGACVIASTPEMLSDMLFIQ